MAPTPTSPVEATLAYAEEFHTEDEILPGGAKARHRVGRRADPTRAAARPCASSPPRSTPGRSSRSAPAAACPGCGCSAACARTARSPASTWSSSTSGWPGSAFAQAGFAGGRVRLITGRALDVLPRLSDGGYDLVFCDAAPQEYADYLAEASGCCARRHRRLRQRAARHDRVADPAQRDRTRSPCASWASCVRADERLRPLLLPLGDGLLAAVKLL